MKFDPDIEFVTFKVTNSRSRSKFKATRKFFQLILIFDGHSEYPTPMSWFCSEVGKLYHFWPLPQILKISKNFILPITNGNLNLRIRVLHPELGLLANFQFLQKVQMLSNICRAAYVEQRLKITKTSFFVVFTFLHLFSRGFRYYSTNKQSNMRTVSKFIRISSSNTTNFTCHDWEVSNP